MVTLTEKENGLLIELNDKKELKSMLKKGVVYPADILENGRYLGNGWDEVHPEKIGALTDSPIIGHNISWDDNGEIELSEDSKIYWFPDYMVCDPWKKLLKERKVFFTLAD